MGRPLTGITIKDDVQGGRPCICGSRIPVARMLAELADGLSVEEFAEDYEVSEKRCKAALQELSRLFNIKSGSMT